MGFATRFAPICIASMFLAALPAVALAGQVARLTFQSDPGDFIGKGKAADVLYTPSKATLSAQVRRTVGVTPGSPAELLFTLTPNVGSGLPSTIAFFGTDQLAIPIAPGTYPDAERADFASPGHPGLDISYNGSGCNTVTGSFTVNSVTFSGPTVIQTFDASFEQHCEGAVPALRGTFTYNANVDLLSVTKAGTGTGSVTSAGPGIDCGGTCDAIFGPGEVVTLTAAPTPGSFFAGWSGDCAGTGACTVTMSASRNVTATFTNAQTIPRLVNISTRLQVLPGENVLIGGFIVSGTQPKTVAIRARGPSLAELGIPNALADPRLELYAGATLVTSNDDWGTSPDATAIQARGVAPADPKESAMLVTLVPGAYTAVVSGVSGATGVGIIEVFETDRPEIPITNISTRGQVGTGANVMIGGFIIQGDSPKTVIVRARGPSLAGFGIANPLLDPVLQLFTGSTVIATNDDWQASADAATIQAAGFAPSDAREAVIRMTLSPGAYTAIVSGKAGATGVAIVEVFAQ